MGVYTNDATLFWHNPYSWIPYEADDAGREAINDFNVAIGRCLFVPRERVAKLLNAGIDAVSDYIFFKSSGDEGGSGVIGREKHGKLDITYGKSSNSRFHELGHCVGLGHEYFHPGWPHRARLLNRCACANLQAMRACPHGKGNVSFNHKLRLLNKEVFLRDEGKYSNLFEYDARSVMNYTLSSMRFEAADFAPAALPADDLPAKLSDGDIKLVQHLYPHALPLLFQALTDEKFKTELRTRWGLGAAAANAAGAGRP